MCVCGGGEHFGPDTKERGRARYQYLVYKWAIPLFNRTPLWMTIIANIPNIEKKPRISYVSPPPPPPPPPTGTDLSMPQWTNFYFCSIPPGQASVISSSGNLAPQDKHLNDHPLGTYSQLPPPPPPPNPPGHHLLSSIWVYG